MVKLVLSPEALDDLEDIATYIGQDNPVAAHAFVDQLEQQIRKLADNPGLGHERRDLVDRPVRFWPVGRYLVIYRAQTNYVEIVRVISSYRNLPALFD